MNYILIGNFDIGFLCQNETLEFFSVCCLCKIWFPYILICILRYRFTISFWITLWICALNVQLKYNGFDSKSLHNTIYIDIVINFFSGIFFYLTSLLIAFFARPIITRHETILIWVRRCLHHTNFPKFGLLPHESKD